MFQNRLVTIMLIILASLTLIGVVVFILYTQVFQSEDADAEPSIEEVIERSVETSEITTNLYTNQVIRAVFVIEADSEDAKEEVEMRDFQVNNIIISELSDMSAQDLQGSEGMSMLEENIRSRMNEIMQDGSIVRVYIKDKVIQ
ncbi:flagellar basal body-associated protein FliL [Alkalicoccus urumqiensis]|uniref:Flagellar protein FliL n=1 Tax=Alkalicoccus urumqiensis TaxID=1548213 RepID=A0A2P6MG01_ALKUR|nr:flagellar basal body-associated protein FliL [Alkalicoccus urumqiensis]PRO65222.1 flagellar basal body-associated protein FliL [Alkalicoccus urumqiensis]